jgi:hypothetical protein
MIEVTMGQQDICESFKPNARLQDLPLCALAAVDQKTIFVMRYDLP